MTAEKLGTCSQCKGKGIVDKRLEGRKEIRTNPQDNQLWCRECMQKKMGDEYTVVNPEEFKHRSEVLGLILDALMGPKCNRADCIGCNPQNFNEKGEFQKERLH